MIPVVKLIFRPLFNKNLIKSRSDIYPGVPLICFDLPRLSLSQVSGMTYKRTSFSSEQLLEI